MPATRRCKKEKRVCSQCHTKENALFFFRLGMLRSVHIFPYQCWLRIYFSPFDMRHFFFLLTSFFFFPHDVCRFQRHGAITEPNYVSKSEVQLTWLLKRWVLAFIFLCQAPSFPNHHGCAEDVYTPPKDCSFRFAALRWRRTAVASFDLHFFFSRLKLHFSLFCIFCSRALCFLFAVIVCTDLDILAAIVSWAQETNKDVLSGDVRECISRLQLSSLTVFLSFLNTRYREA